MGSVRGHAANKASGRPYVYSPRQLANKAKYEEALPRVLVELQRGRSLNGIAVSLGLEYESIRRRVKRVAPELIQPPKRRHIPKETKLAAVEDFLERGSAPRVAAHYGVSATSVERWTNQYLCGELR